MKNDHVPNFTGPYLSTGMEVDQSEDIILTTISADIHEPSLAAIAHIFVDKAVFTRFRQSRRLLEEPPEHQKFVSRSIWL
jgi:hypothetical protein